MIAIRFALSELSMYPTTYFQYKLHHYGIRGFNHSLIESYLTDRRPYVSTNIYDSTQKSIKIEFLRDLF